MKIHMYLTTLLLSVAMITHAQDPIPFPLTDASWMTIRGSWDGAGNSATYGYKISPDVDTIIDGETFTTLSLTQYYYTSYEYTGATSADDSDIPLGHVAAIRYTDGQVWLRAFDNSVSMMSIAGLDPQWSGLPLDTTFLLYDFNLQVGDTVYFPLYHTPVMHVSMIDSIMLGDGLYHDQWHFAQTGAVDQIWIEGIGSANGPFGAFLPSASYTYGSNWLNCFKQNDIYVFGTDSCDLITVETPTAIQNATADDLDWYLWEGTIFTKGNSTHTEGIFQLIDMQGQFAFSSNTPHSGFIELPQIQNGIYVGVMTLSNGHRIAHTCIISN